jgi:glutathione S-transferase
LATYTARLAYFHLLPQRAILFEPFTRGIPDAEVRLTRVIYPLQRAILSLLLQLTRKNADAALAGIRAIFDQTDARLRDQRRFLHGERLTLADIALAAAAAPVTLPVGNRSPIPPLLQMPPAFAAIVKEMQARPTAAFVQHIYQAMGRATPQSPPIDADRPTGAAATVSPETP